MDSFSNWIDDHKKKEILTWLAALVEINSYTGNPEGVNRVGDQVADFLKHLGFDETRYRRESIGDHRLFIRPGPGKQILFSCHLDTVFPADLGFNACQIGDPITTGPGVIDMKGGIATLLFTLRMLDDLRVRPPSGYHIFFSADEETGSEDARPLVEGQAQGKDYGLVFECGGPDGEVVSARKGVGTFRIEIEGQAAHAGNDYSRGINANLEAAHKLIAIQGLTNLEIGTTVNVGQIGGGIGANTISPDAFLLIDFRYAVDEEGERVVSKLNEQTQTAYVEGTHARMTGAIQRPVMVETPATRLFAQLVHQASGGTVQTEKRGGVGDANFMADAGVPTLDGWGPLGGKDHTVEEFMYTQSLFERIELLGRVLMHLDP
jgi:glutamate carboxypeptidase